MYKIKGVILTGIWLFKMTLVHEVWTRSLEGKGVNLTGICIFRTRVTIVWTTFDFALGSPKCHFLHQDDPCPWSLELESWRTGGYPETPQTLFYTSGWCGWCGVVLKKIGSAQVLLALTWLQTWSWQLCIIGFLRLGASHVNAKNDPPPFIHNVTISLMSECMGLEKTGPGSESLERKGYGRQGRQPIAKVFRAKRGLALQRKAQSLIRPMETHQINNYLEVERADSIHWEIFERQFVKKRNLRI